MFDPVHQSRSDSPPPRTSEPAEGLGAVTRVRLTELPTDKAPSGPSRGATADRLTLSPEGLDAARQERPARPVQRQATGHAGDGEQAGRGARPGLEHSVRTDRPDGPELEARRDLRQLRAEDLFVRARASAEVEDSDGIAPPAARFQYEIGDDGRRYAVEDEGRTRLVPQPPESRVEHETGSGSEREIERPVEPSRTGVAARAYRGVGIRGAGVRGVGGTMHPSVLIDLFG